MATTGFSAAIASKIDTGFASMCDVRASTSIRESTSGTSLRVPTKRTAEESESDLARSSRVPRSGAVAHDHKAGIGHLAGHTRRGPQK